MWKVGVQESRGKKERYESRRVGERNKNKAGKKRKPLEIKAPGPQRLLPSFGPQRAKMKLCP